MSNPIAQLRKQAALLLQQGQIKEAIDAHQRLLLQQPRHADTAYNLGYLLKADGQYVKALDAYGEALLHGIAQPEEVHLNRAVIYSDHLRRDSEAEHELKRALILAPQYAPALLNLGNLYEEQGKREAAIQCYQHILQAEKNDANSQPIYHTALARMAHLCPPSTISDPLLSQIQTAANTANSDEDRANLFFALGRVLDNLGDYSSAFEAFNQANRSVNRSGPQYDRRKTEHYFDALIAAFPNNESIQATQSIEACYSPLFICGMFRSGSTLVEQVLATHPQIIAGGELNLLPALISKTLNPFPQSVSNLTDANYQSMASDYLKQLNATFPTANAAQYITDKRPDNFLLIGLIKRMFPNAKIIHTTRHPLDNGLSLFMQYLHPRIAGYASNLSDIGHYYTQYRRLMAHWNSLYSDCLFDFDYDAFVSEPEATLSKLLGFLDLEMDASYLNFHSLGNTVKTASYWQVRQPLYNQASGRWQHYRQHLHALEQELAANTINASMHLK